MEEKKLTDEEIKQAFFILRHGSSEGLSEYIKAVLAIEREYDRQKAEIERLTESYEMVVADNRQACEKWRIITVKNAELQKQVDELKKTQIKHIHIDEQFKNECEYEIQQAVKDTADKIVCGLLELFPKGHTSTVITLASIHRIVKEATDGVGVE